ncbi:MAG TPA: thiol:disulfide interchange protein DsbA/DsbL [Steroidobacteraceae bacterium]|nr:thiol:disulfide interchange protein DsbA/DsbL [Steroidobacteraceae bacterium]
MKRMGLALIAVLAYAAVLPARAAPTRWVEGTNYVRLSQPQPTTVPAGKIEVMEVFSYACPFCNKYQPTMDQLERSLPANAQMVFLPAAFKPDEDWPMFQQAYFAAESLGIARRTHQAMFDAVWKTGQLGIVEPGTERLKSRLPTLEDAARYYSKLTGISTQKFIATARSFGVMMQMREANAEIMSMQVPGTPCLIVDGKYRIRMNSMRAPEVIGLVRYLVAKAASHH